MSNENNQNNSARQQNGEKPIEGIISNGFVGGVQAIAIAYGDYSDLAKQTYGDFVSKLPLTAR
jgi:hypothetical protein